MTSYSLLPKEYQPPATGTTFVTLLDMPADFEPLYRHKPIGPGEREEDYDRLFRAMAGEYCPKTFLEWDNLKHAVDARWRELRLARLNDAVLADTVADNLVGKVRRWILVDDPEAQADPSNAGHRAALQVAALRRFGSPTTLHRFEEEVDMDFILAGHLAERLPLLQALFAQRMAERSIAVQFNREARARPPSEGDASPNKIVALAPRLAKPRRAREPKAALAGQDQQPGTEKPSGEATPGKGAEAFPAEGDAASSFASETRKEIPEPQDVDRGVDATLGLEDRGDTPPILDFKATGALLRRVICGTDGSNDQDWLEAMAEEASGLTFLTKMHLAFGYRSKVAASAANPDSCDFHNTMKFGTEFWDYYDRARLARIAILTEKAEDERANSRRRALKEWIVLARLCLSPSQCDSLGPYLEIKEEAEALLADGYFG